MLGTNIHQDVLHARRPTLNYVSPAICEAIFSGSSFATLVLESNSSALTPITGLRYNWNQTSGTWTLYWDNYPDAICYNVYAADNPDDPTTYTIVAECVSDPTYDPPAGEPGAPGTPGTVIVITGITTSGETPFPTTPPEPLPPDPNAV